MKDFQIAQTFFKWGFWNKMYPDHIIDIAYNWQKSTIQFSVVLLLTSFIFLIVLMFSFLLELATMSIYYIIFGFLAFMLLDFSPGKIIIFLWSITFIILSHPVFYLFTLLYSKHSLKKQKKDIKSYILDENVRIDIYYKRLGEIYETVV